jgi:hypothetical protein
MVSSAESASPGAAPPRIRWRQAVWISLAAAILIAAIHLLQGPAPLSHMDFIPGGPDAVEFCDPANPKIIAVAAKSSSVTLGVAPAGPLNAGSPGPSRVRLTIETASGKAVGPDDLISSPGGAVRLFILSEDLADFQSVQPAPDGRRGNWAFDFFPRTSGTYRVFADMTPVTTGRELYASADLPVSGVPLGRTRDFSSHVDSGGVGFELMPVAGQVFAHRPSILRLAISRPDGNAVSLVPFQGIYAHLVLFDEARTGFLRVSAPAGGSVQTPGEYRPSFDFSVTFPDPGRYVAWVIVDIAGQETAVPLAVSVIP